MTQELTVYTCGQHGHHYYYMNQDGPLIGTATCQADGGDWFVFRSSDKAERSQIGRLLRVADITGSAACHALAHAIALTIFAEETGDQELPIMFRGEMHPEVEWTV